MTIETKPQKLTHYQVSKMYRLVNPRMNIITLEWIMKHQSRIRPERMKIILGRLHKKLSL
jgi:hypothetical protein